MATSGNNANFNVTIGANMDPSGVLGAVKQMQGAFNGLKLPANMTGDVLKNFNKLTESLSKFEKLASQDHFSKTDVKSLQKLQKEINSTFGELKGSLTDLSGQKFYLEADYTKIKEARQVVDQLKADIQTKLSSIKIDFSSAKGGTASLGLDTLLSRMEQGVKTSKTLNAAMSEMGNSIRAGNLSAASEQFTQMINKAKGLKGASAELLDTFKQWGLVDFSGPASNIKSMEERGRLLNQVFEKLVPIFSKNGEAVGQLSKELTTATDKVKDLEKTGIENYTNSLSNGVQKTEELENAARQTGQATVEMADGMRRASDEVKQLQQSTQYFFSLRNMINLLKRGIREAVDVVKELDAAMTETAVVTNFSVGDMWEKLPEYTANANALGASVKDMYEATTLYYQQGLDTTAAMGIANETMKMARIGGLEAADATDKMTAALRGFNMELNETSAQRVNDVYSNLAAKTASNTEELGTAMQRTASIAASAGMSFEGTAAFLAQAIETTREPAENLGTAMKTIVARFTELKKNPLEITEIDGEEVDYNKVDTALKSIGVSLKDANGQFRNLDQVFLDISERWSSLTQTQQRYIATTAAGSRQQSRFIAMMSNYERTMQLMDYANNSTGASSEQFGKTMESLEAKINKLKNAWNEFLMNIMNDSWTKGIVDGTTKVLNIVTTLIDKLSFGQKGIKSVLSLFTAFTALKLTGRGANALIGGLGGLIDPNSSFKEGLTGGALGGQAAKISNPIVKAIYDLIPHIDKAATGVYKNQGYSTKENYAGARTDIKTLIGGQSRFGSGFGAGNGKYAINDIRSIINYRDLNDKQVGALLAKSPGLKRNLSNGLSEVFQKAGMTPKVARGLAQGVAKGSVGIEEALIQSGVGKSFEAKMAEITASGGEEAAKGFRQSAIKELKQNGTMDKIWNEAATKQAEAQQKGQQFDKVAYARQRVNTELNKRAYGLSPEIEALLNQERQLTGAEKAANAFGAVGGALSSAGMSLQMFGSQLSTVNPLLGEATMKLGGMLSAAGALPNMMSSIIAGGPAVWAATAAVTALGAAFIYTQHQEQKTKDAAQKITDNFEQTSKKTQDNISKLKQYRSELAILSKGVDVNGNNVSLSDADYQRYLEIVDDIATINPKIVDGYNEQGHAIIRNNNALAETLSIQEALQKKSLNDYIDSTSLQKLIDARNINKDYITGTAYKTQAKGTFVGGESSIITTNTKAPMANAVRSLAKEFDKQKGLDIDSILQGYGISLEQLQAGEEKAVNTFVKNQDQINAQVGAAITTSGEQINESLTESFDKLNEQTANFNAAVEPVVQNLQTYISNTPAFKNIGPEFQSALMSGLKDIAIQPDLDATEMQSQARVLVQEFDNLTAEGGAYATAMDAVEDAQNSFAESLDASEYANKTEDALETLNSLMEKYAGKTDVYSQSIAEYLQNQIDRIKNFTVEGSASLTSALNEVSSSITAAEGAYDSFKESTKTDFSTGADSMKSIYDEVTKETDEVALHMEGRGDNTFWTGARALLGDDFVEKNGDNIEEVKKQIKSLEPMLKEGEEGYKAFHKELMKVDPKEAGFDKWLEINEDGSWKIDTDIEPEGYKKLAEYLGMSEEFLVSMLNKGRQFQGIDFSNITDVRTALATDNATITNGSNIFVKTDYLNNALSEAGYVNPVDQKRQREHLAENGVIEIKNPEQITKKDFDSMGIKDLSGLIKTFGDTGQFNREEIQQYAEKLGEVSDKVDYRPEDFAAGFDKYLENQEHPELEPVQSIESTVDRIAGLLEKDRILNGKVTEEDEQAAKDFHHSIYGNKGVDTKTQHFGKGENEQGNLLSTKQYQQTYNDLEKAKQEAEKWADIYEQGAKNAKGKEKKRLQDIADSYKADADYIAEKQKAGEEAWKQQYAQQKYDETYKKIKDAGFNSATAADEANKAKQKAYETANEITQAIKDGSTEALEDIDTSDIKEDSKKTTKKKNDAEDEGKREGNNEADTSAAKESGKKSSEKKNDAEDEGKKEAADKVDTSTAENTGEEITNKANNSFTHGIERAEAHDDKVNTTGENAGENAYNKRSSSIDHGIQQAEARDKKTNQPSNSTPTSSTPAPLPQGVFKAEEHDSKIKVGAEIDNSALKDAETQIVHIQEIAEQGATFAITTTGLSDLNQAANSAKTLTSNVGDKSVGVTAGVTGTDKVNTLGTAIDNLKSKTVSVKVDHSGLTATNINNIETAISNLKDKEVTVTVTKKGNAKDEYPYTGGFISGRGIQYRSKGGSIFQKKGTDTIPAMLTPGEYVHNRGAVKYFGIDFMQRLNHKDLIGALQSFGSAAKGKGGKLGPNGKGGLTLTGELGYEVAWIPSENRSVILGASGPQMVNLPKDAVVYNHEQSKKILKNHPGIPAGSMGSGDPYGSDGNDGGSGGSGGGGKGSKGGKNKTSKTTSSYHREITKILTKGGKVSVWWENIARMAETRERAAAKTQKKFDKLLETFGTTATKAEKVADTYRADLQKVIDVNKKQVNKANGELKYLDKKGKASISYQVTKKKGSKKTTETKKETVNIGKFIKQMEDGTYIIDQKAITKIAKKNKAKAEAIKQAIEQRLNDKISKRNKALDEIEKAQDKLAEISNNIYDTFYRWEFSLNKIYFLAQKLSSLAGQMDYRQGREELISNRVLAGYGSATATDQINQLLNALEEEKKLMIDQVEANIANAEATKEAYLNSIDFKTYTERYEKAPDNEHAEEDIKAAKWALRLIEEGGNFDESQIEKLKNQGYNEYTINQIKEVLEDIDQKRKDALQASTDANASINTIYNKIVEYESYISEFENDLLTGIEEQTEKEINRLDKLNSSLSKAYKDLLDEVKRALDERRKREDNAKTERDIAQKQQRLAALRADTSGGHQVEIAQLEKEIAEAQQNYQRTLEDQLLENLQNQGDKAEKQRQQQIDLLNAQKEIAQQTGTNLLQVQEWLKDPEKNKEQIRAAWLANKGYDDMTERQKTSAEHEFEEAWMKYGAYLTEVADLREVASNTKFESIDGSVKLGQIAGDVEKIANQVINTKATGGIGWSSFKAGGGTAKQARELGALASSVQSVWGTKATFNAGYTKKALTEAGITVKDLHQVGIKAGALKKRGYKASELKDYYSIKELAEAGYSYKTLKKFYSDTQIKKALNAELAKKIGVPDKTIAKWYGSKAALKAGAGGAAVQSAKGTGLQTQQKIVNESKKDKATQSSLAGISTKLDTNGKKKGGKISATVNASGKSVTGNKGSTLYTRKIDTKTGKLTGDVTTTKIADLSTADFTKNKKEATDALIYAIKHREVGSKISSKMKSLVSAAGIAGKTYKLKNNVTASVGANGKIYYATKDAVKIWDASAGKVDVDKYNKNEYLKKAQKNNSVSREYAQALINKKAFTKKQLQAKGVKKFAAGGLASYTGPAWLDGTPSKPELVLNPTDTKNFLMLKDILASAMSSMGEVSNNYGGNATYEININVDKIEKDYDVDRVAERVKKIIVKDSGYRNVTQVRNFR